jgi:hypothetical protein
MFVQVIKGRTSDPEGMRAHVEAWGSTVGSAAAGWLGSTAGVAEDGTSIALVRFESEEAARRNSERPEQGEWWTRMATYFDGDPEFWDCSLVDVDEYGDPGAAGFVQVMQGKVDDVQRARELMASDPTDWPTFRPDILGTLWAGDADGNWSMAIYFTSEEAAREGEQKEPSAETAAIMEQLNALSSAQPTYLDLRDPWLMSPAGSA